MILNRNIDKTIKLNEASERIWDVGISNSDFKIIYLIDDIKSEVQYNEYINNGEFNITNPKDSKGNVVIKNYNHNVLEVLLPSDKILLLVNDDFTWRPVFISGGARKEPYIESFINKNTIEVKHYLNKTPSVLIYDDSNKRIFDAQVDYDPSNMDNVLTVRFIKPTSGKIICQ